jgi:hypothetical protein
MFKNFDDTIRSDFIKVTILCAAFVSFFILGPFGAAGLVGCCYFLLALSKNHKAVQMLIGVIFVMTLGAPVVMVSIPMTILYRHFKKSGQMPEYVKRYDVWATPRGTAIQPYKSDIQDGEWTDVK